MKSKLGPYVRLLLPNKKDKSSRIFVTGRSKSGKTTLSVHIIEDYFLDKVHRIFVICKSFYTQKTFESIRKYAKEEDVYTEPSDELTFLKIRNDIDTDLSENPEKMFLLFLDDVASDQVTNIGRKGAFASLSTEAPHINLSILALFQQAKACSAAFRNNADNIIMFAPADKDAMKCFQDEFNPYIYDRELSKKFEKLAIQVWEANGFLFIHRPARLIAASFENFDEQIEMS